MDATNQIVVRPFTRQDTPQLLDLMKGLARFENYIDAFAVREEDLIRFGLGEDPLFDAQVACGIHAPDQLLGMAVTYMIPWTYDLRPTVVLKELFVAESARHRGVGRALMTKVAHRAVEQGAARLQWTVLPSNGDAQGFYRGLGARPDRDWQPWQLKEPELRSLADLDQDGAAPR